MKYIRYALMAIIAIVIVVGSISAFTARNWLYAPLPQHDGTQTIAGLNDSVEVIRDEYGVPHIYASNMDDLFFAQGYTHAQDRWWQMEFFRRTGRGELQELTGKTDSLMGTDLFIRTVGWRRSAEQDLAALSPEVRAYLDAFTAGVNAYITNRDASDLAFEYSALGLTGVDIPIKPWEPLDSLVWTKVMAWDLSGNYSTERFMTDLIDAYGDEMARDYFPDYPYDNKPTIITTDDLPAADQTFGEKVSSLDSDRGLVGVNNALAGNHNDEGFIFGSGDAIGSNNWVAHGNITESGMPLLADDPHLGIQMPSIWYEIGLHCQPVTESCPLNVRGFTFSAAFGIVVGHNDNIAWGVTNVGWDTQDLYRIEINPDNELQYRWNGEWRDLTIHEEIIRFGDGSDPVTIQVRAVPGIGPIITDNQYDSDTGEITHFVNDNVLAMRWTAYETGTILDSLLGINTAANWDDFREALSLWDIPAQNFVYADTEGNIGYQTPGRVPVRVAGHMGLLPVDGTTDAFMWEGFVPYEYLPSVLNPERNYIATANQALVPPAYYDQLRSQLGDRFSPDANFEFDQIWAYGYRGQRINEMLAATDSHTVESFQQIHGDNKMIVAEELTPAFRELDFEDDNLNDIRDWMLDWDYQMHMDSPQAALFANVWDALTANLYDDQLAQVGDDGSEASGGSSNMWATVQLINEPDNPWWNDVRTSEIETRDTILRESFIDGVTATREQLGENRDDWRWGDLHTATFVSNPLGASGIGLIEDTVNYGPISTSGGSAIVNATGWSASNEDFRVRSVPSMRMIIDMSDFRNNRTIHTTGQSGHPASDHYADMVEDWANIRYNPMLWYREDIEASAQATLVLEPQN